MMAHRPAAGTLRPGRAIVDASRWRSGSSSSGVRPAAAAAQSSSTAQQPALPSSASAPASTQQQLVAWAGSAAGHVEHTAQAAVRAALQLVHAAFCYLQALCDRVLQALGLHSKAVAAPAVEAAPQAVQQQQQQAPKLSRRQQRQQQQQRQRQQQQQQQAEGHTALAAQPAAAPAAQRRAVTLLQAAQRTPVCAAFASLSPLQRAGASLAVLLAVGGPMLAAYASRRAAARAEEEQELQAKARSLMAQKQRFQAALAFDSVQLDLPSIKESSVSPSDLAVKPIEDVLAHAGRPLEGAVRREWLKFMAASKVGLVTDLWDAQSKCNDAAPRASRAQLEEMTRRVREANSTAGKPRARGGYDGSDDDAGDEWFLEHEEGVGGPGAGRRGVQEQLDEESMEVRAARRRARMAGQFASDDDVASMWTAKRAGAHARGAPAAAAGAGSQAGERAAAAGSAASVRGGSPAVRGASGEPEAPSSSSSSSGGVAGEGSGSGSGHLQAMMALDEAHVLASVESTQPLVAARADAARTTNPWEGGWSAASGMAEGMATPLMATLARLMRRPTEQAGNGGRGGEQQ